MERLGPDQHRSDLLYNIRLIMRSEMSGVSGRPQAERLP